MFSKTSMLSKSAAPWKSMLIRRRTGSMSASDRPETSSPNAVMLPRSIVRSASRHLSSTLLPMPEPPTMVRVSPRCTVRSSPS